MSAGCLLIESPRGWQLVAAEPKANVADAVELPTDSPSDVAASVADAIANRNFRPDVVIAPSSCSTCFVRFESDVRDRQSLLYEMEASLPFDAESATADFSFHDEFVSGVAIESSRWKPLFVSLESHGVRIQSVAPLAVLASCQCIKERHAAPGDAIIWQHDNGTDIIVADREGLQRWKHVPLESSRLNAELAALNADNEERRHVEVSENQVTVAARMAAGILNRREMPWYELRRDALVIGDPLRAYSGPLRLLFGTAILALGLLIGMSLLRQFRLEGAIERVKDEQRNVFKEAFPESRIPAALVSRMKSEHRKALGARQTNNVVPETKNAIEVIDTFLAGLSGSARCRITRLVVEDGAVRADVQLRNHNDAGRLAASLEKAGFAMLPPGTEQLNPQTVTSRLEGRIAESTSDKRDGRTVE